MQGEANRHSAKLKQAISDLAARLVDKRALVITGAGISTESGIPDYRGQGRPQRKRKPIQHQQFIDSEAIRRRYWTRAAASWDWFSKRQPNLGHRSLVAIENKHGAIASITQNVDSLLLVAGSTQTVELHGALRNNRCLGCGRISDRNEFHQRLLQANPFIDALGRSDSAHSEPERAPDGDTELDHRAIRHVQNIPSCTYCGGVLMPNVVFFGGRVPADVKAQAEERYEQADCVLALGTSLAVHSSHRFVRYARRDGKPFYVMNRGPCRSIDYATLVIDAPLGSALAELAVAIEA